MRGGADAKGVSGGAGGAESKLVKDIMSRQAEQDAAASAKKTDVSVFCSRSRE